ncbi:MAG TPA: NAD(P)-binding domain-containing protein, partial [Candidatus Krumholzibacteria bacterium]|nr:NAD(P)-binding domain-containing protein [Candidatus Krumholzibacteria bacterium]
MMWLTSLIFIVLTGLFMRWHVRRRSADTPTTKCPRCSSAVPAGAARCPRCQIPMQLYEVVKAKTVVEDAASAGSSERPHAVVRADLCVGCGACVPACPEPGAIKMAGKLATVEKSLCKGHGKCVEACPVGGIVLATGASVHRVEVPLVDTDFESNVGGVYVVGELGGRGLIKNAINEAKVAVEHIAGELGGRTKSTEVAGGAGRGGNDVYDVIVVGSGPAGISAGLEALRHHLRYLVLEQGTLADTIRKYPRAKFLLAEPVAVPLYGDLWVSDATKEQLLQVWESIIERSGLEVRTGHRVTHVSRADGVLRVETSEAVFRARRVVLAMGRRGNPRRLGVPGEELGKVIYDVADMDSFAGQRMMVVGGGDSAAESAVGLSRQPGTTVVLSYRGETFARVKERNRAKLDDAVKRGTLRIVLNSEVREIREGEVTLDVMGRREVVPNDVVVVRIGGEPPYTFLEKIGVHIVKKDIPLQEEAHAGA